MQRGQEPPTDTGEQQPYHVFQQQASPHQMLQPQPLHASYIMQDHSLVNGATPNNDEAAVGTAAPAPAPASIPISSATGRGQRLPPRSRTGCWTCRRRKVKCDEVRPVCAQCSRLQQICDYGPRITFRDDTPRICSRMRDISLEDSPVWHQKANTISRRRATMFARRHDDMPPFRSLTNDEERERKASFQVPGAYFVLALPLCFSSLPDCGDSDSGTIEDAAAEIARMRSLYGLGLRPDGSEDEDMVILERFEMPMVQTMFQSEAQPGQAEGRPQQLQQPISQQPQGLDEDMQQSPEASTTTSLPQFGHQHPQYQLPISSIASPYSAIQQTHFEAPFDPHANMTSTFGYEHQNSIPHHYHHAQQHMYLPPLALSQSQQMYQMAAVAPLPLYTRPSSSNMNIHPTLHRLQTHSGIPSQTQHVSPVGSIYQRRVSLPLSTDSSSMLERYSGMGSPYPPSEWWDNDERNDDDGIEEAS